MMCSEVEGNGHRFAIWTGLPDENLGVFEVGVLDSPGRTVGKL